MEGKVNVVKQTLIKLRQERVLRKKGTKRLGETILLFIAWKRVLQLLLSCVDTLVELLDNVFEVSYKDGDGDIKRVIRPGKKRRNRSHHFGWISKQNVQELYYGKRKEAWLCWSKIQMFIRNTRYDKERTWALQAFGGDCKIKRTAGASGEYIFLGTRSPFPDENNQVQEKRVNRIISSKGEELTIIYTNADSIEISC